MQVFRGMIWLLVAVFVVLPDRVSMFLNNIDDGIAPNELDRPSECIISPNKPSQHCFSLKTRSGK